MTAPVLAQPRSAQDATEAPAPLPVAAVPRTRPDLSGYHAVHAALRQATRRMARSARTLHPVDTRRVDAFATYWKGYAGEVLAHHTIEDDIMFPDLVRRAPEAAELITTTDRDHHRLDELMEAAGAAVAAARAGGSATPLADVLDELADHMDEHLAFEDALLLPLFDRTYSAEEYDVLEKAAMKHLGIGRQAAFTVPFIAASMTPEARRELLAGAPAAFWVLFRLTRRSHARLTEAALGTPVVVDRAPAWF